MFEKQFTDADLVNAYLATGSTTKAAKIIGCSYETIRRACVRNNIRLDGRKRNTGAKHSKVTDNELIESAKTMTRSEIAEKYNVCISNIDRRINKLGIKCSPGMRGSGENKYLKRMSNKCAGFDRTINLQSVFDRDKGICKICGKPVNINERKEHGSGRMYPTIDHIKPLSKGGSHTWDNVQLAHNHCNAGKCDKLVEVI